MNFGQAIEALKAGKKVSREGWNGKNMHIYLEDDFAVIPYPERKYKPCIVLFDAQGNHQPGWNASTPDVLAEDWGIVG